MEKGVILKGVGGVYEVQTEQDVLSCTLRGRLRLEQERVLTGDHVEVTRRGEGGVVERVLARKNELSRPAIANLDQVLAVFAVDNPGPDLLLLDRILVQAAFVKLPAVVIFNKGDLGAARAEELRAMYAGISDQSLVTSAKEGWGVAEVERALKGKTSALVGPSGVGKSSLLNALRPGLDLKTSGLSAKVQRGKHTTRSVQLFSLGEESYVADTPGFSRLNLGPAQKMRLQNAFPEFGDYVGFCRFRGCLHHQEPGCAVKEAVQRGEIPAHRYEHYLLFLLETDSHFPRQE